MFADGKKETSAMGRKWLWFNRRPQSWAAQFKTHAPCFVRWPQLQPDASIVNLWIWLALSLFSICWKKTVMNSQWKSFSYLFRPITKLPVWLTRIAFRKKETMASRPFATISDQEIENLIERSIPEKKKTATKYGMKIFNGKIHVCMHMKHNFV